MPDLYCSGDEFYVLRTREDGALPRPRRVRTPELTRSRRAPEEIHDVNFVEMARPWYQLKPKKGVWGWS